MIRLVIGLPGNGKTLFCVSKIIDELLYSDVKGKNPFKDKRVRQAVYHAIDIEANGQPNLFASGDNNTGGVIAGANPVTDADTKGLPSGM